MGDGFNNSSSHWESEASQSITLDYWLYYLETAMLFVVIILTVFGNLMIMLCILLHEHLRRPSHHFIASLALTDMMLGLVVMVPRLTDQIYGEWLFGFRLCQMYHAMDVTLCTASILHLSCISLDRYYAVVSEPLLYYDRMTSTKVNLMIAACWILAALTGFVPVFTGIYSSSEHLQESMDSSALQCDLVVNKYFSVIAGIVSFWLPASVMVYVYARVYRETRRLADVFKSSRNSNGSHLSPIIRLFHLNQTNQTSTSEQNSQRAYSCSMVDENVRQTRQLSVPATSLPVSASTKDFIAVKTTYEQTSFILDAKNGSTSIQNRVSPSTCNDHHQSSNWTQCSTSQAHVMTLSNRERESRAAVTLGIVIGVFLISWLPFFIWMPLTSLLELETPPLLYNIILWVGYTNSAVNPFIYGIFSREFRGTLHNDFVKLKTQCCSSSSI